MNIAFKAPLKERDSLDAIGRALFHPMGADGVYARTGIYEQVVECLSLLISRHREPGTEIMRFPPVMSRQQLEKSGYLKSFPHLLGCVSCLDGDESEIGAAVAQFEAGKRWDSALRHVDLVLSPAACYPVYPLAAARGLVPAGGLLFDVACDCFRREPSRDLDRLQSFRMREYVCIGTPQEIAGFRERWMTRAGSITDRLGLP
jgi:seryl-tRNA synthetase